MKHRAVRNHTNRPGGDAIHIFVAGSPDHVACLLPHLDEANEARGDGYFYVDFHNPTPESGAYVELALAEERILGKWTPLDLASRLRHSGLGYLHSPVVALHDDPEATMRLVREALHHGRAVLGYLTVALPGTLRFGIQFALAPDDPEGLEDLEVLMRGLGELCRQRGAEHAFAVGCGRSWTETDAVLCASFAEHLERNALAVLDLGYVATPGIERVLSGRVSAVKDPAAWLAALGHVTAHATTASSAAASDDKCVHGSAP